MPEPNTQTNLPIDPPVAAAAPPTPVVAQPARQTNRQRPQQHKPNKREGVIEIPQAAFKARVQREAAVEVKRRLGITMEEAEALVKNPGAAGNGKSATGTADAVVAQVRAENERLRKQVERSAKEREESDKKTAKQLRRANDKALEAELKAEARMSGVVDPDYAVNLFAKAVAQGKATEPAAFFAALKTSHPHLYVTAASPAVPVAPTVVAPTTVPPESLATGEVKPIPSAAGAPPKDINAEELSPQEFAQHQRKYGYVPGMS